MTVFAGFPGLFVKEVQELAREKRLLGILLFLGLGLTIPYWLMLRDVRGWDGVGATYGMLLEPVVYVGPMALTIVALTFAADCVSKERDSGMLGLVLSTPVSSGGLFLAKVAGALAAYATVALFTVAFFLVLGLRYGWVVVESVAWFFLVPFLALYVFMMGVGFLLSVTLGSSKTSVGAAIGVLLPVFFLMQEPPGLGFLLQERAPAIWALLAYNPYGVAIQTAGAIVYGEPFSWGPVAFTVAVGAALLAAAYAVLSRQEVAA